MEWRRHRETAPGQYPAASAAGGFCSPALALLPPQRASTGLHAARATPAPRGEPLTTRHRKGLHRERDPLPCAASPFVALVARAAGSQCASSNSWSRHDQTLRHPGTLCCLARVGDRLTTRLPTTPLLPSRTTSPLRVVSCGLFSWLFFPHLLPFWLPVPLLLLSLTGSTSRSQRLSLLQSGLALQHARCASRGKCGLGL